jgi:pimeloyl-[acyl-carrier protein] methyl ester esterase
MQQGLNSLNVVVLPGLDGSRALRIEFIERLRKMAIPVECMGYPIAALPPHEFDGWIRARLPNVPFVMVAESFGGPLAIRLAASPPPQLRGVILVASFARLPIWFRRAPASIVRWLPLRAAPGAIIARALLGRWSTPASRQALDSALVAIPTGELQHRLALVHAADERANVGRSKVPISAICARQDRLLGRATTREWQAALGADRVLELDGPHALLQAVPDAVIAALQALPTSSSDRSR